MNLLIYDSRNVHGKVNCGKDPIISIYPKYGLIKISPRACELMVLKAGQRIILVWDEDSPQDWYIAKTEKISGFTVRQLKEENNLIMTSKKMCHLILSSLGILESRPTHFLMAGSPTITKDHQLFAMLNKTHS